MDEAKQPKALVTGGAGFLGTHLIGRLLSEGYEVTCLDNLVSGRKENIAPFLNLDGFKFLYQDVTEPCDGEFDEIYNLACPASPPEYQKAPLKTLWTSIDGIRNCLELARRTGAKMIHASTSEIYGDPLVHPQSESYWGNVNPVGKRSCYDEGKRVAETIAAEYRNEYGVDVRIVRIFNTYGPFMSPQDGRVITNFVMAALKNEDITIYGDGSQTRSFQYCDDLIEALRRLMKKPKSESMPILNLGNPREFTIKELAEKVLEAIPTSESKVVYRELPSDDPRKRRPDITLAKAMLDWEPKVSLEEGLKKVIEHLKKTEMGKETL